MFLVPLPVLEGGTSKVLRFERSEVLTAIKRSAMKKSVSITPLNAGQPEYVAPLIAADVRPPYAKRAVCAVLLGVVRV